MGDGDSISALLMQGLNENIKKKPYTQIFKIYNILLHEMHSLNFLLVDELQHLRDIKRLAQSYTRSE